MDTVLSNVSPEIIPVARPDAGAAHVSGAAGVPAARPAMPAGIPAGMSAMPAIIDELLRDRAAILARIRSGAGLADLVRTMLLTIAVAAAIFGAALGSYRGGVQIAYAAIKLPLVLLLTAALCAPCLSAFNAALDRPFGLRRDVALVLTALAFGSLLLVAQAPLLLLFAMLGAGYHTSILLTCACAALAGLASLILLGRGVRARSPRHANTASLALLLVFAVVGAQMAWTLRPYLVRPRTPEVPFVRSIEGSFLESVLTSMDSARGHYRRDFAPVPGQVDSSVAPDHVRHHESTSEDTP